MQKNLSCITVDPTQRNLIAESNSSAIRNYWKHPFATILHKVKFINQVPTVQVTNNNTITVSQLGLLPLNADISPKSATAHFFDGPHSAYTIYLGQLHDDDCIAILKINKSIFKNNEPVFQVPRNHQDSLWDIPISIYLHHGSHVIIKKDKTKIELNQYLRGCCFRPTPRTFLCTVKF